jgi:hypothetical protein
MAGVGAGIRADDRAADRPPGTTDPELVVADLREFFGGLG